LILKILLKRQLFNKNLAKYSIVRYYLVVILLALALPALAEVSTLSAGQIPSRWQNLRQEFEQKRAEALQLLQERRDVFKQQLEQIRSSVKNRVEQYRQELKNRLKQIKDERKRQIVERVYNNINELNKRLTDHFTNVVDKLDQILEKITSRTDKAAANSRDVSGVRTKINNAKNALASARTTIKIQADRVYTLNISTESALKLDVGQARQTFHADIVKVRQVVKAARDAIHEAAVTLAQIPKIDELELPPATTSPTNQ